MLAFLKKYGILIFLGVLFFLGFLFISKAQQGGPTITPTPTPSPFGLESIFPPPGEDQKMGDPKLALQFTFNKQVDTTTTVVTIKPTTAFRLSADSLERTLYISPIEEWKYNQPYQVEVEARSSDGEALTPPIQYTFKVTPITNSPLSE